MQNRGNTTYSLRNVKRKKYGYINEQIYDDPDLVKFMITDRECRIQLGLGTHSNSTSLQCITNKRQTQKKSEMKNQEKFLLEQKDNNIFKLKKAGQKVHRKKQKHFDKLIVSFKVPPHDTIRDSALSLTQKYTNPTIETTQQIEQFLEKSKKQYETQLNDNIQNENEIYSVRFPLGVKLRKSSSMEIQKDIGNKETQNLEIVDNNNQKVIIQVINPPYYPKLIKDIPNPFDKELRNKFVQGLNFSRDFKSGYTPIEIQKQQQNDEDNNFKQHFIRKKQSSANVNLKRTCGVSYVKKSESQQKGVENIFKKLPPLVFQCSSECQKQENLDDFFQKIFRNLFYGNKPLLISVIDTEDENLIRNYLQEPSQRFKIAQGRYFILKSLEDLWPLIFDKNIICIHWYYHHQQFVTNPEYTEFVQNEIKFLVERSDVQLGIMCKRSLCGKKSVIKTFFPDEYEREQELINDKKKQNKQKNEKIQEQVMQESFLSEKQIEVKIEKLQSVNEDQVLIKQENSQQNIIILQNQEYEMNSDYQQINESQIKIEPFSETNDTRITMNSNNASDQGQRDSSDTKDESHESIQDTLKKNSFKEFQEFLDKVSSEKQINSKNINTLSLRLELYTAEDTWRTASKFTKNLLFSFILFIKDKIEEKLLEWIKIRYDIFTKKKKDGLKQTLENIAFLDFSEKLIDDQNIVQGKIVYMKKSWNFQESDILSFNSGQNANKFQEYQDNLVLFNAAKSQVKSQQDYQVIQEILGYSKELCGQRDFNVFALPLYLISTRDSFAYDLIQKKTQLKINGRNVLKTEYFFSPDCHPSNFSSFVHEFPDYRVGVVTYENLFTHEELLSIESQCFETEKKCFYNHYLPMTGQTTCTSEKVRRTKFFFGARYMWSRVQLTEPQSFVGAGVRVDVSEPPQWLRQQVENPLVDAGIIPKNFVNSITMNVYHDGKEGLAQHFDDAVRFKQPIFTLRIFSDCRLSFGSQLYGFCNGAFCIPMSRGCITVMEENSYAANGIKHCVRPCDMTGKSSAIILRQMHERVMHEAKIFNEFVDFPTHFSTLSLHENAVSYSDQKKIEAETILSKAQDQNIAVKEECKLNTQ